MKSTKIYNQNIQIKKKSGKEDHNHHIQTWFTKLLTKNSQ